MSNAASHKWWVLLTLCVMVILFNIDYTAVNLALANIATTLRASLSTIQWVVTAYTMMAASFTILGGRCADIFGFKRLFITSVITFGAASLLAGLANSGGMLITARAFQGVAFAFFLPIGPALIFSIFEVEKCGAAMGIYISAVALAQSIGPTIGGMIVHWLSWRYIFFINVPLCVLAALLGSWSIKSRLSRRESIDFLGLVILVASILLITYAFNEGHAWGMISAKFISLIVISVFGLFCFVLVERKIKAPLIDLNLFLQRSFTFPTLIRAVTAYVYFAFLFIIGLLLQNILGLTPIVAGVMLLTSTFFVGVLSLSAGFLFGRLNEKLLLVCGLGFLILSFSLFLMIDVESSLFFMTCAFALIGAGVGIILPVALNSVIGAIPSSQRGQAGGILYTIGSMGTTLGPAVTGFIIGARGNAHFANELVKRGIALSRAEYTLANRVVMGTDSIKHLQSVLNTQLQATVTPLVQHIFIGSFKVAMLVCWILSCLGMLMVFISKNKKRNSLNR